MPPSLSGFTFVRNAMLYDYPVVESLKSLLPLCSEVVVAVGRGEDSTRDLITGLSDPKIRIINTEWDERLREGGRVLAQQTNLALQRCTGDWCIYLQADEVLHEADYNTILTAILAAHENPRIEALLVSYYHFYGSYDFIGVGRQWYRQEIRLVRNTGRVISWRDAQGFRRLDNGGNAVKLRARPIDAHVYHYGWVKPPNIQQNKQRAFHRLWHDEDWITRHVPAQYEFDYASAYSLAQFTGMHPAVMNNRIEKAKTWTAHFDPRRVRRRTLWGVCLDGFEKTTGIRLGEYKNFVKV